MVRDAVDERRRYLSRVRHRLRPLPEVHPYGCAPRERGGFHVARTTVGGLRERRLRTLEVHGVRLRRATIDHGLAVVLAEQPVREAGIEVRLRERGRRLRAGRFDALDAVLREPPRRRALLPVIVQVAVVLRQLAALPAGRDAEAARRPRRMDLARDRRARVPQPVQTLREGAAHAVEQGALRRLLVQERVLDRSRILHVGIAAGGRDQSDRRARQERAGPLPRAVIALRPIHRRHGALLRR